MCKKSNTSASFLSYARLRNHACSLGSIPAHEVAEAARYVISAAATCSKYEALAMLVSFHSWLMAYAVIRELAEDEEDVVEDITNRVTERISELRDIPPEGV